MFKNRSVTIYTAQAEAVTDDEDPNYVGNSAGSYHPEVKKKKGFLRFFGR
jgi:hypothetical protein